MRTSLILSVIVLVWGTHLLLTPSFYLLSEKTFYSHAHDIMDNISDFTLEQSYNHLEKAKSAVTLTKQLLSANVFNTGTLTISSLERYFFNQLKIHPHLAGIYLGTPDGSFYYVSRNEAKKENGFRTKIIRHNERERSVMLIWRDENFRELQREQTPADPYDPRKRPWYKQAVQSRAIGWTDPYIFYTSKQPGVTIAGPSYWEDNSLKGVIGVDIDLKELSSFVGKLRVGKTGKAFIFSRNRDVLASRDLSQHIVREDNGNNMRLPKIEELEQPLIGKAMAAVNNQIAPESLFDLKKPLFTSFTAQKQDFVAMFTPFPGTELDWIVAMYLPEEDYLGEIRSNRRTNLIATVLLSLIASILAFRFARAIIAPIKCLQQEARAIEDQDLQVNCTLNSVFTELQETADGFKRMKQSIANYSEKLRAQEKMYRIITNAASDAIILINEKREISYLNPAAEDFFALASEEARGKNVHDLTGISWDQRDLVKFSARPLQNRKAPVELEIINEQGKHCTVEVTLSPVTINKKVHTVAILRDTSERNRSIELKKQLVQDLHDGVGGSLVNIKLLSQMVVDGNIAQPTETILKNISDICDDSILEIRSFMDILDAKEVTWESLFADLHQYCAKAAESHQLQFIKKSDIQEDVPGPSVLLALNLFKIVKEGMTNIIRHANAKEIHLSLQVGQDNLYCSLKDNGSGLLQKKRQGRGLLNIKNRVVQLGGKLAINGTNGTSISLVIPLYTASPPLLSEEQDD